MGKGNATYRPARRHIWAYWSPTYSGWIPCATKKTAERAIKRWKACGETLPLVRYTLDAAQSGKDIKP